jgi:hypothetical protein
VGPEPEDAHVWLRSFDRRGDPSMLAPEELDRASRFKAQVDADRFVSGRSFLRAVLGHYLQVPPREVQLSYGPNSTYRPGVKTCASAYPTLAGWQAWP